MKHEPTAFEVQIALLASGQDPGRIDGVMGPRTRLALDAYALANGINSVWAEDTLNHLVSYGFRHPPWLAKAFEYHGLKEFPGKANNSKIINWFKTAGAGWFKTDSTPWCGAFVGAMLVEAGFPHAPNSARARSYEDYGQALFAPIAGAIVVFWRGRRHGKQGHVGFVIGTLPNGDPIVLGGNQGDAVTIAPFKKDRVLGYRWPAGAEVPDSAFVPVLSLEGIGYSRNEA